MTTSSTDAFTQDVINGRDYVLLVSGGALDVKYQKTDETWAHVTGSPFPDGSQKIFSALSSNGKIQFTPGTAVMDVQFFEYKTL